MGEGYSACGGINSHRQVHNNPEWRLPNRVHSWIPTWRCQVRYQTGPPVPQMGRCPKELQPYAFPPPHETFSVTCVVLNRRGTCPYSTNSSKNMASLGARVLSRLCLIQVDCWSHMGRPIQCFPSDPDDHDRTISPLTLLQLCCPTVEEQHLQWSK